MKEHPTSNAAAPAAIAHPRRLLRVGCWLLDAGCFLLFLTAATANVPVITFTVQPVEPDENGSLVYTPVAADTGNSSATARFWYSVKITNQSGATLRLNKMQATFSGPAPFARSVVFNPTITVADTAADFYVGLPTANLITLSLPVPPTVTISLFFDTYTDPKSVQRALVPYVPSVPNGQYFFHADEGDIGPEEYFAASNVHKAGEFQAWGADWVVYRTVAGGSPTTIRPGGSSHVNEDHLGWGVPIRAMADGIVLRTSTGWIANPEPGKRAFQMTAQYDGEAISDVKVTRLSDTRAASLLRLPSGGVDLVVWEMADVGRQITRLGSSGIEPGESVIDMAIDDLTASRVVGVLRLSNNSQRVVVWDITNGGNTVTRTFSTNTTSVLEVSLMRMAEDRFATAVSTAATGDLQVQVWNLDDAGLHLLDTDIAEAASSICTSALSDTRVAISLKTAGGLLKVIVWDLIDNGGGNFTLDRKGDATADAITRVAASVATKNTWTRNKWVTAACTNPGGVIKLIRWDADDDGTILPPELETTTMVAIQNTALAIAPNNGADGADNATTASIAGNGTFQINGWGDPDEVPSAYDDSAYNIDPGPAVTKVSIDQTAASQYFVGARSGGALKIMTWRWAGGGGNCVYVLHGDCRVLYAHFQKDTVDTSVLYPGATVTAGQVLGLLGNSGASGGPHTHVHSDRLYPLPPIDELLALEAADQVDSLIIGTRPIPFTAARAMRLGLIAQGGEDNASNSFATMNGQGNYNEGTVSLGIRPRINTRYVDHAATAMTPTGRKEPVPGNPFVFPPTPATGGPVPTVAQGVSLSPSGARLYIRGGSYDETLIFNTPMTIRRYDFYDMEGAVIIGK